MTSHTIESVEINETTIETVKNTNQNTSPITTIITPELDNTTDGQSSVNFNLQVRLNSIL